VAPDALCLIDPPASGAALFCPAGGRASSGLALCDVLNTYGSRPSPCGCPASGSESLQSESDTTISTISLRGLVDNARYPSICYTIVALSLRGECRP
jgi:hypothetical protein